MQRYVAKVQVRDCIDSSSVLLYSALYGHIFGHSGIIDTVMLNIVLATCTEIIYDNAIPNWT